MKKTIKSVEKIARLHLKKLKFSLGLDPIIEKSTDNYRNYISEPYKAVCLISADVELAWAYRFSKQNKRSRERAIELGLLSRRNVPEILRLCETYQIPITWATVGHLFLESCQRINGMAHSEIKRLPYFENQFWKYDSGDWFDDDPCTDFKTDTAWYCPDLIQQIIDSPVRHENGCHTFSHIDCRDGVCSDEVFLSEIEACKKAAKEFNINLKSFVHPGHQIGNLNNLYNAGFTSYRTDYGDALAFPKLHPSGLWELRNTSIMDYRKGWSVKYHIKRYQTIVNRAIKHNKVCVLWFHPSFNPIIPEAVLPELFKIIHNNKDKLWVTTHAEYIDWLNKHHRIG